MTSRAVAQPAELDVGVDRPRLLATVGPGAHVALVSLPDERIVAISSGVAGLFGTPEEQIIGRSTREVLRRPLPRSALELIGKGYVDFYRAHLVTRRALGNGVPLVVWVSVCEIAGRRYVLAAFAPEGQDPRPLYRALGMDLVVATVDRRWRILAVSDNGPKALGVAVEQMVGRTLVLGDGPQLSAVGSVIREDLDTNDAVCVGIPVRGPSALAQRQVTAVVLMGAADPQPAVRNVILARPLSNPDGDEQGRRRAGELEQHLWRIAAEVEASGILHRFNAVPGLRRLQEVHDLSPRQWEVLRRLLNGQRVPTISAELFLSQSTVRNHLTAIFERFGVHSQAELLARLSDRSALPS
jgi:DNA-binding CsgD family transcriptional regulator